MLVLRAQAEFMKFFGKGQVDDRILHTKVTNVSLKQAQDMIANKVNERYGGGPEGPAQLKRAFQSFDSGRSGSISIPDFKTAMIQYTQLEFEDNIIGCGIVWQFRESFSDTIKNMRNNIRVCAVVIF